MGNQIELRNLIASDLPLVTTILRKIGWKQFKGCLNNEELSKLLAQIKPQTVEVEGEEAAQPLEEQSSLFSLIATNVAFDAIGVIIENYEKAEQDIYKFFSRLTGKTPKDIGNLELGEFIGLFYALVKKPQFGDFFNHASKLTQ